MNKPNPIASVNAALKALGEASRLRRGRGYYYFDGKALAWPSSSVMVQDSTDLSVGEWLAQYDALKQEAR